MPLPPAAATCAGRSCHLLLPYQTSLLLPQPRALLLPQAPPLQLPTIVPYAATAIDEAAPRHCACFYRPSCAFSGCHRSAISLEPILGGFSLGFDEGIGGFGDPGQNGHIML